MISWSSNSLCVKLMILRRGSPCSWSLVMRRVRRGSRSWKHRLNRCWQSNKLQMPSRFSWQTIIKAKSIASPKTTQRKRKSFPIKLQIYKLILLQSNWHQQILKKQWVPKSAQKQRKFRSYRVHWRNRKPNCKIWKWKMTNFKVK